MLFLTVGASWVFFPFIGLGKMIVFEFIKSRFGAFSSDFDVTSLDCPLIGTWKIFVSVEEFVSVGVSNIIKSTMDNCLMSVEFAFERGGGKLNRLS
ncbi:hypothetical protein ROZALSC1DRAFT_30371 [Rozella allomycis CSF55]|uniref:Uncharacterized protein n=1 Tax=Rozella allomycis (strain CSF55) TaxID=988480 RepID=A0A075AN72_ROZAC|nr:hypothetical protein O9G_005197 [Rozella allomycis CSF55]RKP17867.1 hypothetical protein ROZALSC1DRAFT_30371 [Rozella allomycis CSF55]|eukprot:EPZ31227.1 hypothetical protein O9G_005197 [Rozella allomycis CSF55]